jgi:hypothetical protein
LPTILFISLQSIGGYSKFDSIWCSSFLEELDGADRVRPKVGYFCEDENIKTQKEDHFDRRMREKFNKVNGKMRT